MRHLRNSLALFTALLLLLATQVVMAQGNSEGKGNGRNKNIGVGNASDGIKGRIVTEHDIYYTGDPLAISLHFPRGADLVTGGEADAYVVVFAPSVDSTDDSDTDSTDDTDEPGTDDVLSNATVLPVTDEASATSTQLFSIGAVDISVLPAGTYQLGLILTNPDGDPLNINDWYNGLLGLVDVVGLTVTDQSVDFDVDGDGEVDDDDDGDGFSDDDDEEDESDDSGDDSSDDSGTDSL